jgi:hypothetical protein
MSSVRCQLLHSKGNVLATLVNNRVEFYGIREPLDLLSNKIQVVTSLLATKTSLCNTAVLQLTRLLFGTQLSVNETLHATAAETEDTKCKKGLPRR